MFRTIKIIAVIAVLPFLFLMNSCFNDPIPTDERTPEIEQEEIANALARLETKGYDIDTTALGVYYIMHTQGTGPFPQKGDTCYLEYAGYFINSVLFDTSKNHYTDGIWEFIYQDQSLIPGFENGISLLNKGAELDMIIPSALAYGPFGNITIPPYSPLIFSVKMHDLKAKNK